MKPIDYIDARINEDSDENNDINKMFYRLDDNGNAVILYAADGEPVTRIDANVYPIGSNLSTRYEHAEGIVLTVADALKLGIKKEE